MAKWQGYPTRYTFPFFYISAFPCAYIDPDSGAFNLANTVLFTCILTFANTETQEGVMVI